MARAPDPTKEIARAEKAHKQEVAAINKRRAQQQRAAGLIRGQGQGNLVDEGQRDIDRKHAEDLIIARKRRDQAVDRAKKGRPALRAKPKRAPALFGKINWTQILRGPSA